MAHVLRLRSPSTVPEARLIRANHAIPFRCDCLVRTMLRSYPRTPADTMRQPRRVTAINSIDLERNLLFGTVYWNPDIRRTYISQVPGPFVKPVALLAPL